MELISFLYKGQKEGKDYAEQTLHCREKLVLIAYEP